GQPDLHRLAAIEIDGRKERLLILVGTHQSRGDKECEYHVVGSTGMEKVKWNSRPIAPPAARDERRPFRVPFSFASENRGGYAAVILLSGQVLPNCCQLGQIDDTEGRGPCSEQSAGRLPSRHRR